MCFGTKQGFLNTAEYFTCIKFCVRVRFINAILLYLLNEFKGKSL